jgi:hypothetical protein
MINYVGWSCLALTPGHCTWPVLCRWPAFMATVKQLLMIWSVGSLMQGLLEREMHPSPWEMAPAPTPFLRGPRRLDLQDALGWPPW